MDVPISSELDVSSPDVAQPDAAVTPDAPPPADVRPTGDGAVCGAGSSMCGATCVDHRANPSACGTATNLGAFCGDTSCGTLCPSTRYRTVVSRTGRASVWLRARATECSLCPASLVARVNLAVPAGIDYDLFIHRPCGGMVQSSIRGAGQPDSVEVTRSDTPTTDEGYDYFIEVRYISGASCEPWTLTIEARGNNGSAC